MARKGGGEPSLEQVREEERRLMVELGEEWCRGEKQAAEELGQSFDLGTTLASDAFKRRFPEPEVQAAIRRAMTEGEATVAAPASPEGVEGAAVPVKEKKGRRKKTKLTNEEIAGLQGEGVKKALESVTSVKEARRFAEVFEKAGRQEDALSALERAWSFHDRKNKADFNGLTADLIAKLVEIQGLEAAKKFVREQLRPLDAKAASVAELNLARLTTPPKGVTVGEERAKEGGAQQTTFVRNQQRRFKPFEGLIGKFRAGKSTEVDKPAEPQKESSPPPEIPPEEFEILSEKTVENALRGVGIDPEKSPEDNLAQLEVSLEQVKTDLGQAIATADLVAIDNLLGKEDGKNGLIVELLHGVTKKLDLMEIYDLDILISDLESEDFQPAEKLDYWKKYFDKLKKLSRAVIVDSYNEVLKDLINKAEQRKAELLDQAATPTQAEKPEPKQKRERRRGRRGREEEVAPESAALATTEAPKVEAMPEPQPAAEPEPRPRKTAAERKAEDEQVIAEKIGRIKAIIDKAVATKEKTKGQALEHAASFKFGRAIGMGEYTLLVLPAKRPNQRPHILNRDAESCVRVVKEYAVEFAQAVGMSPEEARGRLEALVKEVYDERTAKGGGEYIYPNIDPSFGGKRQRLQSGTDDIAALKLAEIGERVQLPENRRGQFAGLLDFFEASRRLQKEMVAADLQAKRARREAEQLAATGQALEKAVKSCIRGREEAAAQVERLKHPGEFKFAGALRGGEDAIFALCGAERKTQRDIVEIGIPAWRQTAEHFLPEFAREVGLNEPEFRDQLDKIIADLQARREKEGKSFKYQNIDPSGAQIEGQEMISRWPLEKLLEKMKLPKDPENTVIEALDYFDALQDIRERLKASLRDQRENARTAQAERVREMRENRELRLPSFAGEVELDALLWASDKEWWGEDEDGWERARQAVVLYQREHFGKDKWGDERKAALREIMRMVWARREFVVAKKVNAKKPGLDSRSAIKLLEFAGIKIKGKPILFVPSGRRPEAIHANISGEEGVVSGASYPEKVKAARKSGKLYDPSDPENNAARYVSRNDRTLSFDHHNAGISLPDAAAAQYLFETLEFLGFFTDKNEHFYQEFTEKFGYTADNLRKALELVMYDDTKAHPAWKDPDSDYWKGPWQRSLLAIAARAEFKSIVAYVKDNQDTDFTEEISPEVARKYGFVSQGEDSLTLVEVNEKNLELAKRHWAELVKNGYSVYQEEVRGELRETTRYYLVETENSRLGKVKIVFIEAGEKNKGGYHGGGFPGSIDALRALGGRDVFYIIYTPPYEIKRKGGRTESKEEHIFANHTDKDLPEDLFPGGKRLRKRMWNYTGEGLKKNASIRAIFERLGVSPEELKKNKALEKAMKLEEYNPEKPLTPEEVGLDVEKAKVLREILREELVEKYADEFEKEYPSMAERGREHVLSVAEDYVKDKGEEELEKKFQRALHAKIQRKIAKQRS